jgi:hypothetical protein
MKAQRYLLIVLWIAAIFALAGLAGCASMGQWEKDHPKQMGFLDKTAEVLNGVVHDPVVNGTAQGVPGGSIAVGVLGAGLGWYIKHRQGVKGTTSTTAVTTETTDTVK